MNLFSPEETVANYAHTGAVKARMPLGKTLALSILAGLIIAFGGAATSTVSHALANQSLIRLASGLLFPFGLCMVVAVGAELFTGNCLISISVLSGEARVREMARDLGMVYLGNFLGAVLLAAGLSFSGQFDCSSGGLAVYTVKLAAAKCALPFFSALTSGFFCNILVCLGVLMALSAKDTAGRLMGAYIPVAFFVMCGFEHSIANMYYIPAGLFALANPIYAQKALEAGIDVSNLTWPGFALCNLVPVTIGNLIGGMGLGALMYGARLRKKA